MYNQATIMWFYVILNYQLNVHRTLGLEYLPIFIALYVFDQKGFTIILDQ